MLHYLGYKYTTIFVTNLFNLFGCIYFSTCLASALWSWGCYRHIFVTLRQYGFSPHLQLHGQILPVYSWRQENYRKLWFITRFVLGIPSALSIGCGYLCNGLYSFACSYVHVIICFGFDHSILGFSRGQVGCMRRRGCLEGWSSYTSITRELPVESFEMQVWRSPHVCKHCFLFYVSSCLQPWSLCWYCVTLLYVLTGSNSTETQFCRCTS